MNNAYLDLCSKEKNKMHSCMNMRRGQFNVFIRVKCDCELVIVRMNCYCNCAGLGQLSSLSVFSLFVHITIIR